MSSRTNPRQTARWQRIRANIGECSVDVDPDQHADNIYAAVMGRPRWNVDEELAAELADSLADGRRKNRNGSYKRKAAL